MATSASGDLVATKELSSSRAVRAAADARKIFTAADKKADGDLSLKQINAYVISHPQQLAAIGMVNAQWDKLMHLMQEDKRHGLEWRCLGEDWVESYVACLKLVESNVSVLYEVVEGAESHSGPAVQKQLRHELMETASEVTWLQSALEDSGVARDDLSKKLRIIRLQWVFSLLDLDSDGAIDTNELLVMTGQMEPGQKWSPEANNRMHTAWDLDGDGFVTVSKFV